MWHRTWIKYPALALLISLNLLNGWFRTVYLINGTIPDMPFIVSRRYMEEQGNLVFKKSSLFSSLWFDPYWLSNFMYAFIAYSSTVGIISLLYFNRKFLRIVHLVYLAIILLLGILLMIVYKIKSFSKGYIILQDLKDLLQTPLLTLFLIALFSLLQKIQKARENSMVHKK